MMEKIESLWKVGIRFNEIQFIGIAPRLGGIFGNATEQALLTKAVDYIEQAQKFAECIPLSKVPEGMGTTNKNDVMVGFTLMFKDAEKAKLFLESIKQ